MVEGLIWLPLLVLERAPPGQTRCSVSVLRQLGVAPGAPRGGRIGGTGFSVGVEAAILMVVRQQTHPVDDTSLTPRGLLEKYVARVVVKTKQLAISLKASGENAPAPIEIPWSAPKKRDLVQIDGDHVESLPRRSNTQLVQAVVRAHAWLWLLTEGTYDSIESLARSVDLHPKVVRSRIRLAFLDPNNSENCFSVPSRG